MGGQELRRSHLRHLHLQLDFRAHHVPALQPVGVEALPSWGQGTPGDRLQQHVTGSSLLPLRLLLCFALVDERGSRDFEVRRPQIL